MHIHIYIDICSYRLKSVDGDRPALQQGIFMNTVKLCKAMYMIARATARTHTVGPYVIDDPELWDNWQHYEPLSVGI